MLPFLQSLYHTIRSTLEQPFPIEYAPCHHEIETLEYFNQSDKVLFRDLSIKISTKRQVILCFTNRCGSNWLAELLYATELMGLADEFFNTERIQADCAECGLNSLDDFVRHLPGNHSTLNKIFATKLSWDQLYFLSRVKVIPWIIPNPQFIYIVRDDVAAQALSFLVAQQTGQWKSNWNSGVNGKIELADISNEQIIMAISEILFAQSKFELYFEMLKLNPCRIHYEDLLAKPEFIIARILQYLKIPAPKKMEINSAKLQLEKQRDEQSEKRLARFHRETEDRYNFLRMGSAAGSTHESVR